MSEILFVSKPIAPPWNDGTRNLVRDVAGAMTRHSPVLMGVSGAPQPSLGRGRVEEVYDAGRGSFALGPAQMTRLAQRLALGPRGDLWHFFFTPSPRVVAFAKPLCALRGVRAIQTIPSAPRASGAGLAALVFAERAVVLSRASEARFLAAGIAPERLRRVPPAVAVPEAVQDPRQTRASLGLPATGALILYAGDLETGGGARRMIDALGATADATLVMACRAKTQSAAQAERALRRRAERAGVGGRVRWVGETRLVHGLIAAATLVALPSVDLHAKVDLPLVLIEAMHLGRPVVVARGSSAEELADEGGARAVDAGPEALGESLRELLASADARSALGERARRAAARFSPSRVAAAYETIYDELLR